MSFTLKALSMSAALAMTTFSQALLAQEANFLQRPLCNDIGDKAQKLENIIKRGQDRLFGPKSDGWQPYPQRFVGDFIQTNRDLYIKVRLRLSRDGKTLWFETTISSICENKILARGKRKLSLEEARLVDPDLVASKAFSLRLNSYDDTLPQGFVLAFNESRKGSESHLSLSVYRSAADLNSGKAVDSFELEPVIRD